MTNKIFLILFCMILLVGTVSAFNFDNKIFYSDKDMKVKFSNTFGWGKDLGTAELKSHKSVDEVLQFGFGKEEVVMYYDFRGWELYRNGLGAVYFTDERTGKDIKKDYYFVEWKDDKWIKYDSKDIPNRNIRIGLKTYVGRNDYIDGIWTIVGKEVEKHARWTENGNWSEDFDINATLSDPGNYFSPTVFNGTFLGEDTYWMISGTQGGTFSGFKWNGSSWEINSTINSSITTGVGVSEPFVFYKDTSWYLITGNIYGGGANGYTWNGTGWASNTTIVEGLPSLTTPNDIGGVSVFYEDSNWYLIAGSQGGTYKGFVLAPNQTIWLNDTTIVEGLPDIGDYSRLSVWNAEEELYAISGGEGGIFWGYKWDGSQWQPNHNVNNSLPDTGERNSPSVFFKGGSYYMISGGGYFPGFIKAYADEPIVTLNSPINNTNSTINTIIFNCSACDDTNLVNVSLEIDGVLNETNSSGINNTFYIFNKILSEGDHNWTCLAANNLSQVTTADINLLTIDYLVEEETFYNLDTYETAEETFTINITTNGSYTTSAILFYNGISQGASTKIGTNANANFSNTIQIPNSYVGVKEFLWQLTIGSTLVNTTAINQTVNSLQLNLCNATLTVPYINFTFMDEETLLNINATIDASTWSYWLGDGTYTKSLIYSNNTINNFYAFCLSASNDTLHNTRSIQYALAGYPQRKYDASSDLTNSTLNKTLYLLSSSDGIYSTIQVVDENGDKVSDVGVTAERQFSGVWTVVGEETTDSAGAVTFWVNPDYDHKFTFVSDDCTDTSVTVRPTQTQYTQQLQCGAGAEVYVSQIEGIRYTRGPREGIIQPGVHNFTYYITSSKSNIVNASFKIVNSSSDVVLNSTFSSCAPGGCLIHFLYNVTGGDDIKGKYYVDIGNGTFLLEGDAHWVCVNIPTAGKTGMATFFKDIIYVLNEWGDESETADFNRIVVVFFFMCLSISFLNYHFNIDAYPGALLVGITLFVWLGSLVGGTTSQGLFYFNNLVTGDAFSDTAKNIINNYLLAFLCSIQAGTFFLAVNKRAQQ